jgi:DnaJ-class molecular chaperone
VKNYYQTLGVDKSALPDEIKQAYRKLASKFHPDKGGDTVKFQEIQEAYGVLGDDARRAEYDNPRPQFSGFPGGSGFNMHDMFGQMFGQQFGQPQQSRRNHVRMTIWVSLQDVAQGGSRAVNVSTTAGTSTVAIEVPRGIDDGDQVQYGGVAPGGMDLVVQFRIQPMAQWRREGLTLHTEHRISIWDMILGAEVEVTNILGHNLVVQVPAGTQPGTVMRLRGHGIQDRHGQTGDLMIRMQAQIPKTIAPEIVTAIQQHRS